MKKKDKKIWCEALRSQEYEQGEAFLCKDDTYCCLGVAFDVLVDGYWIQDDHFIKASKPATKDDSTVSLLSSEVLEKIGLSEDDQMTLSRMNDLGWTFEQIADWIEENL